MSDINKINFGVCATLRHDGVDAVIIEQLTYLLFMKMADEKSVICRRCDWESLK